MKRTATRSSDPPVLVVCSEDQEAAELIASQLMMSGFRDNVTVVSDVDRVEETLDRVKPALVVCQMSAGLSGAPDACIRHAGSRNIPVLQIGGHDVADLPSPCSVSALRSRIAEILPNAPQPTRLPHDDRNVYWELIDGASEIILLIDAHTQVILDANRRAIETYGYSREELSGMSYLDLVPSDQHLDVQKSERRISDAGRVFVTDRTHLRRRGEPFRVSVGAKRISSSSGEILQCIVFEDSDRFQRESELLRANLRLENLAVQQSEAARHSEELLRIFVENLRDYAVVLLDPEGHVATWNPGARSIIGYATEEVLGRHFSVFYAPDDVRDGKPDRMLSEARQKGLATDRSTRRRKDGSLFWAEVLLMPVERPEGETWFAKITRDVSERVESVARLRRSERMWHALATNVPDYVTILDREGRILTSNRILEGMDAEKVIGTFSWDYVTAESRERYKQHLEEVLETGKSITFEVTGLGEEGMVHRYENYLGRIEPTEEDEYAAILIARDVTERRRLERDLADQRTMAIRSDRLRSIGQMATGIAHELNQPLSGVRGLAEYLKACLEREWDLDREELLEKLDLIVGQADRMTHIIEHVRRFARGADDESGEEVSVNEVVDAALVVSSEQFKSRKIEIGLDLSAGLPPVFVNPFSLEEVLLNLLLNARDAIEEQENPDPPRRTIVIRSRRAGDLVALDVVDRGAGIPEAVASHVFEPFYTTKDTERGTGLGLPISKSIVESFGGKIEITSVEGIGTTVTVLFPEAPDGKSFHEESDPC